jgi:hypothetical protein
MSAFENTFISQNTFRTQTFAAGGVVGIATAYGLDGPGIESRWGEVFCTCSNRPRGPPSLLYYGYRFFPGVKVRLERDANLSPPSSAEVKRAIPLFSLRAFVAYDRVKPTYLLSQLHAIFLSWKRKSILWPMNLCTVIYTSSLVAVMNFLNTKQSTKQSHWNHQNDLEENSDKKIIYLINL